MPTYAYECASCGHRFEEFQTMTAAVLKKCPACKKPRLQRLIGTGAGVIFKGSGFYETDYKRSKSSEGASKNDAPTKDTAAKDTPKKDNTTKDNTTKDSAKTGAAKPADARSDRGKATDASGKNDHDGNKGR